MLTPVARELGVATSTALTFFQSHDRFAALRRVAAAFTGPKRTQRRIACDAGFDRFLSCARSTSRLVGGSFFALRQVAFRDYKDLWGLHIRGTD